LSSTKFIALTSLILGIAAITLPYFFGNLAVALLGGVMMLSGIVTLLLMNAARADGLQVSVFAPWLQIVAGIVILFWPSLALWLVALILGGGLILSGLASLSEMRSANVINPPAYRKYEAWFTVALGALLIVMGAAGSAVLLGIVLGIALIGRGLRQWRMASH
jgi:uncharacterized membrane protein HdeD (DUF308 family)